MSDTTPESLIDPSPAKSRIFFAITFLYLLLIAFEITREQAWYRLLDATLLLLCLIALTQYTTRVFFPAIAARRTQAVTDRTRTILTRTIMALVLLGLAAIILQLLFQHGPHAANPSRFYVPMFLLPTAINDFLGNPDPTPAPPPSITFPNAAPLHSTHWGDYT